MYWMSTFLDSSMLAALRTGFPIALHMISADGLFHDRLEATCKRKAAVLTRCNFQLPQVEREFPVGKIESR